MPKRRKATKAEAGKIGGLAWVRNHTFEERSAIGRAAALARWGKRKLKAAA